MFQFPDRIAALDAAVSKLGSRARLPWAFPLEQSGSPDFGTPQQWADAWSLVRKAPPRLAIVAFPAAEPVLPWLRLLHETKPGVESVSFRLPPRVRTPVDVSWPLRLGFIPGNAGEGVIDSVRGNWPSKSLTRKIALGRDDANCDVLVYRGTPRVLLAELLALVAEIKTHFVLLLDAGSEDYSADKSRLDAALNELHASGYALM